jgi:hypothetical protein
LLNGNREPHRLAQHRARSACYSSEYSETWRSPIKRIFALAFASLGGAFIGAILAVSLAIAVWFLLDRGGFLDNHTNWYGLGATIYALPLGAIAGAIVGALIAGRRS